MTFEQAKQNNLDVYTMPLRMRSEFVANMNAQGRACTEFEETVVGFILYAVAVGPRQDSGQIARAVKRHKTVREFIQEQ